MIRVFQRALRKQKLAHASTGMRHWRAYVVEKRHADHRRDLRLLDLRKCVARFRRRSLAFAFLRWEASVEAQYRLRRLLSNCVLHKRKAAFRAWAEGVIERRDDLTRWLIDLVRRPLPANAVAELKEFFRVEWAAAERLERNNI